MLPMEGKTVSDHSRAIAVLISSRQSPVGVEAVAAWSEVSSAREAVWLAGSENRRGSAAERRPVPEPRQPAGLRASRRQSSTHSRSRRRWRLATPGVSSPVVGVICVPDRRGRCPRRRLRRAGCRREAGSGNRCGDGRCRDRRDDWRGDHRDQPDRRGHGRDSGQRARRRRRMVAAKPPPDDPRRGDLRRAARSARLSSIIGYRSSRGSSRVARLPQVSADWTLALQRDFGPARLLR